MGAAFPRTREPHCQPWNSLCNISKHVSLSPSSHCNKFIEPKQEIGEPDLQPVRSTGKNQLECEGCFLGTEPITCGIWCYLQVDSFRIELANTQLFATELIAQFFMCGEMPPTFGHRSLFCWLIMSVYSRYYQGLVSFSFFFLSLALIFFSSVVSFTDFLQPWKGYHLA
jgi:hypothetical protein